MELSIEIGQLRLNLQRHKRDYNNPHQVTALQAGASASGHVHVHSHTLVSATDYGAWTALTPNAAGNWANYGDATWANLSYRKLGDSIELGGLVKRTSGTVGIIGTLPVGFRPTKQRGGPVIFSVSGTYYVGRLDIKTNGDIFLLTNGGVTVVDFLFLDNVSYPLG